MEKNFYKRKAVMHCYRTVLLVFAIFWTSLANAELSQGKWKPERLENYLKKIELAYKVSFVYDADEISKAMIIEVPEKLGTIQESLEPLKQKNIGYRQVGNQVILKIEVPAVKPIKKDIIINGVVKDKKEGTGVPGVSIFVKGTNVVVASNEKGEYQISVKDESSILVFKYLGYKTVEVAVGGRRTINIDFEEDANQLREINIVSTGYQTLDRKLFTGSATKISAKDSERSGVPDISRMLEGQAAGVSVQNVSGTFGAAPKIRVRGATSLSGDNKPLWVVDGIILEDVINISNEALSTGDASTLIGSSVAGLNPDDIESFTILKDAAATAMYGARAMNGVIVVTTKKGRDTEGKANINYSSTFTTYLKPNYNNFDIMNSGEQMSVLLEMENKGYYTHSSLANSSNGGVFNKMYNQMYDYNIGSDSFTLNNNLGSRLNFLSRYASANTDWFDILFKNSLLQEHSLSVNSGTARSQTYFSTSYTHDSGQTLGDNVKRYTANLRSSFKVSDRLSAELLMNGSIRDQRSPGTLTRQSDPVYGQYSRDFDINPYSYSLNTSRVLTPYAEDGSLEFFTRNYAPFNIMNELQNNYLKLQMLDLKVQAGVKYKILSKLTYSIDGAYRYARSERQHHILGNSNMAGAFRANPNPAVNDANIFLYDDPDLPNEPSVVVLPEGGFFNVNNNNILNYYLRNNLEFDSKFGENHRLNVFGSYEMRYTDRQNSNFDGVGYQYDNGGLVNPNYRYFKKAIEGGAPYYGMGYGYDRFLAAMARAAYSFKERYSFNATVRNDGSNLMGRSKVARWLPTWNVSGAWDIDQESFFKGVKPYISGARVRATYGLVGSLGAATNSSAVFYNRVTYRPYENEKESQIYTSSLENSELTWEKLYELNIGTDLTLFNNKINLTFDYYKRNIFDLIGAIRTSGIGGQFTKFANYGEMKAYGYELTVSGSPVKTTDFKWRTQFNFGFNKNEVTRLDIDQNIWTLVRAEGAAKKGYAQRGLFSIEFDGLNPQYGYPTFVGLNGVRNETNIPLQDTNVESLVYHGPVDPIFTGGFWNQFSYKNFTLSALFTFSTGNYVRLQPTFTSTYSDMTAMSKDLLNRWIMPGDEKVTNIPSIMDRFSNASRIYRPDGTTVVNPAYPYNAYNYSDQRVAKGDFVRLKNISFSYLLPAKLSSKVGLANAQLSIVGNNVALLYSDKKLNGADPEFFNNGGVAMPIPKQYTLSLKVGF
ncbi:SusC/RagA family TonB-linked outer membrane protein [Pedobacter insulae]|uniref:TonB-linked outer membrane protein, SusC/RagA family n=1 Tax=Pedobacter insulae TaxID=414048 RepID=A0A1I2TEU1_9SPHI|nr:SusC/RagA family TonB-linked outer membrane protein [Pedobacter insulae]SFG63453.1 TonB-linked outer membrane protein, SusC/RagA family [Pedobacter insulae]